MNIKGKLCINFEVDTNKFKRDYVTFLYNVAKKTIEDWDEYCDGIQLSLSEDSSKYSASGFFFHFPESISISLNSLAPLQ